MTATSRVALPRTRHRRPPLLLVVTLAVAAMCAGVLAAPSPAAAAELGPGFAPPSRPLDHLGAYLAADGTMTYCIDVGEPSPVGLDTVDAGTVDTVNDLTEEEMLQLSVVLSRHGTTTDPRAAAAVAMAVWGIASGEAYRSVGGDARVLQRAPESERAAIQQLADEFRAEAAAFVPVVPAARLQLTIADDDEYSGALAVSVVPAGASGSVTLTDAVFTDTGLSTRTGVTDGARLVLTAIPPRSDAAAEGPVELEPYRVSAIAEGFTAPGQPSGTVRLFTTPGAQTLVAASAMVPTEFGAKVTDSRDRAVPTLATIAQATGLVGGTIRDSALLEHVPASGLRLSFAAYLQPEASAAPDCTPGTLVFETAEPLTVTADGTYPSADFATTEAHVGTIFWIATLTRDDAVVARGACGDPTEITVVSPAPPRLPVVSG